LYPRVDILQFWDSLTVLFFLGCLQLQLTTGFASLQYFGLSIEAAPCRSHIIEIKIGGACGTAQSPAVICSLQAWKGRKKERKNIEQCPIIHLLNKF
jgi:hypothetical protein